MPSLGDFIAALKAGWYVSLVSFVGCSIILLGAHYQLQYLNSIPAIILSIIAIVGVFSFIILVADILFLIWKALQRIRTREKFRLNLIEEVNAAPDEEKAVLAYLVTSGRKAFAAHIDDSRLAPLVSKGLIIKISGNNQIMSWPYKVRQEVWNYLIEHREHFYIDIPNDASDPFHWKSGGMW